MRLSSSKVIGAYDYRENRRQLRWSATDSASTQPGVTFDDPEWSWKAGRYWPTCSYWLIQRSQRPHRLTSSDQIWLSNSSREIEARLTVEHCSATLGCGPNFWDSNIRQHGMTYKSNQILQGDQKWEVTFFRVHRAPHTRSGPDGAGKNLWSYYVCLYCLRSLTFLLTYRLTLFVFAIHVIFPISVFYCAASILWRSQFQGAYSFVLCPRNCGDTTHNWRHPKKFPCAPTSNPSRRLWPD